MLRCPYSSSLRLACCTPDFGFRLARFYPLLLVLQTPFPRNRQPGSKLLAHTYMEGTSTICVYLEERNVHCRAIEAVLPKWCPMERTPSPSILGPYHLRHSGLHAFTFAWRFTETLQRSMGYGLSPRRR